MGRYTQVGICGREVEFPIDLIFYKQLTMRGSMTYTARTWDRMMEIYAQRAVRLQDLVSMTLPITAWRQGFDLVCRSNRTESPVVSGRLHVADRPPQPTPAISMKKKEPRSIKDIALAADVSHSTVSRALRNSPLVSAETADRIRRIAAESNYRLSAVGRSLATGRTYTLGVVVSSIADPFVAEVVSGIEETASARGYSVMLATTRADPDLEMKVVQTFEERRVDGLLITASRVGAAYAGLLAELKIPMVVINNQYAADVACSVVVDNVAASRAAVKFLVQLGHRKIGYVGDRFGFQSDAARLDGYRQALAGLDLPARADHVVAGDSDPEGGMRAMEQLLARSDRPTAVFCYNDMTAIGVLTSIARHNLRVPEDISVVGFDDILVASYTQPPLTTVRQPKRLLGNVATETLLNLLSGSKTEVSRRLQAELIVRESTARPLASEVVSAATIVVRGDPSGATAAPLPRGLRRRARQCETACTPPPSRSH